MKCAAFTSPDNLLQICLCNFHFAPHVVFRHGWKIHQNRLRIVWLAQRSVDKAAEEGSAGAFAPFGTVSAGIPTSERNRRTC